jgi:hypothetical protein
MDEKQQWWIHFIHYNWKWTLIDEYHPLNENFNYGCKMDIHRW